MIYSYSSVSTYELCPKKFSFQYKERLKVPEKESIDLMTGKLVHESLEQLYLEKDQGNNWEKKDLIKDFEDRWRINFHSEVIILIHDEQHYKSWGIQCLDYFYDQNYPFDQGQTIGIEKNILFELEKNGPKMKGVIDRLVIQSPEHIQIHDYKTHQRLPDLEWFEENKQLPLYQLWVEQEFPQFKKIELIWDFIGIKKTIRKEITREKLIEVQHNTLGEIKKIEQDKQFKPKMGNHCQTCSFQPHCPAFNPSPNKTLFDFA